MPSAFSSHTSTKRIVLIEKRGPAFDLKALNEKHEMDIKMAQMVLDRAGVPAATDDGRELSLSERVEWLHQTYQGLYMMLERDYKKLEMRGEKGV